MSRADATTWIDANSSVRLAFVPRYYEIRGPSRLSEVASPFLPSRRSIMQKRGWLFWYRHNIVDKKIEDTEGERERVRVEKKNGRMPACQQVDKGLETCARARANICKSAPCTSAGHILFGLVLFVNMDAALRTRSKKWLKWTEYPNDNQYDKGKGGRLPSYLYFLVLSCLNTP